MMYYYKKTAEGFSLIEMLVAVSILLLVIVGPMTITARTAKSSAFATEQVQAFFLAQEGLELVQKVRDDLLLQYFAPAGIADPWARFTNETGSGKLGFCYGASGCGLEWPLNNSGDIDTARNCATSGNCLLYIDSDADRAKFTHRSLGNTATQYTRQIILDTIGDSVLVRSIVTWRTGSLIAEQRLEVATYLYKIYDTP